MDRPPRTSDDEIPLVEIGQFQPDHVEVIEAVAEYEIRIADSVVDTTREQVVSGLKAEIGEVDQIANPRR